MPRREGRRAPGRDTRAPEEARNMQDELLGRFLAGQEYPHHPRYRRLFYEEKINPTGVKSRRPQGPDRKDR